MLCSMSLIDTRDRHPDIAELRRLLDIIGSLTTGFGVLNLILGLDASDRGATRAGMLLLATGLCFVLIRLRIDRVRVDVTVGATAATVIASAIALTVVEPIYFVFSIVPLLAVGVALPYLRGRVLGTIMVVAWVVAFGINVVLETSTNVSLLSPEAQSISRFGGFLACIGVFLLQLWRFSSRLHAALDQTTSAERSRADSETRYGALVDRLAGVVYMSSRGADTPTYYVSPQIEAMMGYTPEEWLAGSDEWIPGYGLWASRIHPEDRERVLVERADRLTVADSHTWEYRLLTKDGRELWVRDDKTVVQRHADGTPKLIQGLMVDITDQKRLEAQLSHQAFHDALTGLPNRTYFTEQVTAAIARARRSGQGMVVVYLDLDDFKVVNDTFGHGVGDRLLVEVARRLRATVRTSDLAARVGGDEFNLLLEGFTDEITADDMVRRLLVVLSEPYRLENDEVRIRATAGIAGLGSADYTVQDLQRNADAALYEAKAEGKSRQAWFDPAMGARASARVEIENGLRRALELGEIELAYQPVVDLRTGLIAGVEALARWRHRERGMIPPAEFIPVAERAGLIVELGRFVLREACLTSVRLSAAAGQQPVPVSVNVSARQIVDSDFVNDVRSALAAAGLAAECLTLELTESILILEEERADQVVAALNELGVRLAIDDFGTGHSSLSYARRFPVDELKIDRSFVDGLGRSREDAAIVAAAIAFARALHLAVTAEGVETPDQAIRLRALGCDRAQGYLFARPMDEAALAAILREDGLSALNDLAQRLQAG
jgi:diguanylate cyclase (GGDEF)-like protein/PAS domain S-box-containing protein